MTTIIGLQDGNGCSMFADSQTTNGERPYFHRDLEKIVKRGQYLLAGAGSARAVDIAHWLWTPPLYCLQFRVCDRGLDRPKSHRL